MVRPGAAGGDREPRADLLVHAASGLKFDGAIPI